MMTKRDVDRGEKAGPVPVSGVGVRRLLLLILLTLLLVGCSPQAQLDEPFTLGIGEENTLEGIGMMITVVEIGSALDTSEGQSPQVRLSVFYAWSTEDIVLEDSIELAEFRIELLDIDEAGGTTTLIVTRP